MSTISLAGRVLRTSLAVALATLAAHPVLAQEIAEAESSLSLAVLGATLIYGAMGILLTLAGYFVFDKVVGLNLQHELVEDQNTAIGIMLAGVFIGCSIVVAAVMLS
ncbi:MAG: DUF350 domain-containing protein [Bacteroidota bacterium]